MELWRNTLSQIPSYFGRLVLLASLREDLTGRYSHPPMERVVGDEITDRTLRQSHHEIFSEWLRFTLAEQMADLDRYLSASLAAPEILPYRNLPPATAHQVERQLYLADLETLLELRRFTHDGALAARAQAML